MPSLALWVLALFGLSYLLADSKILETWIPIRPLLKRVKFFRELLECYFCLGIWLGVCLWPFVMHKRPWRWFIWNSDALLYVVGGAAASYLLSHLLLLVEMAVLRLGDPRDR